MKLFYFGALFLFLCHVFFPLHNSFAQEDEQNYFIVTAYYSPLPDQENYLTGNYEAEIVLNGRGIAGASGKKVFPGMLAAPSLYSFGTKIELEGLGIGEVSDRGGAIVPAGQRGYSHDRIDIWMGHGDEGLRRALYWGKRKIAGTVLPKDSIVNLDYSSVPNPLWVSKGIKKNNETQQETVKVEAKISIFETSISSSSSHYQVAELQTILSDLGYLDAGYTAGKHDTKITDSILKFQLEHNVVQISNETGAGIYGPKTRSKLKEIYDIYVEEQKLYNEFALSVEEIKKQEYEKAKAYISTFEKIQYGEISSSVRELQKTLHLLGYFQHKDTAIYGTKTQNAIIEYQVSKNIIPENASISAGVFGPKTKEYLIQDLADVYFSQKLLDNKILKQYISYVDNENTKLLEKTGTLVQDNSVQVSSEDSIISKIEKTIKKI